MVTNLKLLSVFVLVADHLSFRRAAEELGRSQSAVSTQIRQLEEQLGVSLFHRTTRHVALSSEGQQLLTFAHEALDQIQNGVDAIINAAEHQRRSISIACSPAIASARLAPVLSAFKEDFPHVNVHLRELSSADMLECIHGEDVDFGIGPRANSESALNFQSIFEDELCVVVPAENASALNSEITLMELSGLQMVTLRNSIGHRPSLQNNEQDLRASLEAQFEGIQVQTLLSLADAGLGSAIVPRASLPLNLGQRFRVLSTKPPLTSDICVISLSGKTLSPLAAQLANIATQILQSTSITVESKTRGIFPASAAGARRMSATSRKSPAQTELSTLTAAARKEGRISILATVGSGFQTWANAAQAALPGITIDLHQLPNSEQAANKMLAERQAGNYNYDLVILSAITALPRLKAARALDPLRPLLFLRDVLDDRAWKGGFDLWADEERQFGFPLCESVTRPAINTDLVRESDLADAGSLLDPRWRGKIVLGDLRSGSERVMLTSMRLRDGDDAVRQLIVDQKPTFMQDMRKVADGLVRGNYAIAHGLGPQTLQEFVRPGAGAHVKFVDIPNVTYISYTFTLWAANRAPNPHAAKLFANWMLTRDGQQLLSTHLAQNVRRTDVPLVDPGAILRPGQYYFKSSNKKALAEVKKTRTLLRQITSMRA